LNSGLESTLSTYVEFSNPGAAQQAVRALKAAGFERIEIDDLSHGLQSATDFEDGPPKKTVTYSLIGAATGGILGCAWGFLVFGLPAAILNFPFAIAITVVGLILCIGVGVVIGMEQAYVIAGRVSPDPTSALDGKPVGVRVFAEVGSRLIRAREILNFFTEVGPKQRRWWRMRQFARHIGT
jgi:hypothetical protein